MLAAFARPVDRVEPLGHETLEPELPARGHELGPVADDRQHRAPRGAGQAEALEQRPALDVGSRVTVLPSW